MDAVGFTAFHKCPDALDDLTGTLGLACGFLQCHQHLGFVDVTALQARHQAVAIVVDGGQRLVQFVRDAGGHLAHGDQAAGVLGAGGLQLGLFFGLSAWRDVGGNHHLRQAAIDPVEVA